jgi:hypothetical protein
MPVVCDGLVDSLQSITKLGLALMLVETSTFERLLNLTGIKERVSLKEQQENQPVTISYTLSPATTYQNGDNQKERREGSPNYKKHRCSQCRQIISNPKQPHQTYAFDPQRCWSCHLSYGH